MIGQAVSHYQVKAKLGSGGSMAAVGGVGEVGAVVALGAAP